MASPGYVVVLPGRRGARSHDDRSRAALARRIGALLGYAYAGEFDRSARYDGPVYFVPPATLLQADAGALGIRGERDLFGGVAPDAFVATKSVAHPAVSERVPPRWPLRLAEALRPYVLAGYTAFAPEDVRAAAERLLAVGPVRIKPSHAIGGADQAVVESLDALDALLAGYDVAALREHGLVVEQNLERAVTYSVGEVRIGALRAAYHGTQRQTRNASGAEVYGGSTLTVVRGGFDELLGLGLPPPVRIAVEQAIGFERHVAAAFPSFFASRRNYDVLRGIDREGREHSGVLEQSWRIGGASGAEIAALEAFAADPALAVVRASTHEVYSPREPPPAGAVVLYHDVDAELGPLLKYSLIEPDA